MLEKLEQSRLQIVAFGLVGRGKSSVLNALLGQEIFQAGPLHGVTQKIECQDWLLKQHTISGLAKASIQLLDTPGLDEVDGEKEKK